jgi:hypothetical protein
MHTSLIILSASTRMQLVDQRKAQTSNPGRRKRQNRQSEEANRQSQNID